MIYSLIFCLQLNQTLKKNTEHKLYAKYCKSSGRKFIFSNRVTSAWNALSLTFKSEPNFRKFKELPDRDQKILVNKFDHDTLADRKRQSMPKQAKSNSITI